MLVIDDDATVLSAAKRSLGGTCFVCAAPDLSSARRVFASRQPDFVIVDHWLGAERGLDFVRDVARDHPRLRTALISGAFSIALAAEATTAGVSVLARNGSSSLEWTTRSSKEGGNRIRVP